MSGFDSSKMCKQPGCARVADTMVDMLEYCYVHACGLLKEDRERLTNALDEEIATNAKQSLDHEAAIAESARKLWSAEQDVAMYREALFHMIDVIAVVKRLKS